MTTRLLLIRHGAHDLLGRTLCGRGVDVALNPQGHDQARRLAARLSGCGLSALHVSPRLRARQTAAPIAQACALTQTITPALDEVDCGAWTGLSFAALAPDPAWQRWNADRAHHAPPGGEGMLAVQLRLAAFLATLAGPADRTVAAVTHADVVKAATCLALGLSVDQHGRFDVDPASTTTLLVGAWGIKLAALNLPA